MSRKPATAMITVPARQDLDGIYRRRLAQRGAEGSDGADALLNGIVSAIEQLADFPRRGPVPPELDALGIRAYRQLSLPPYRVVYLPEEQGAGVSRVTVIIVADSRRDFRLLLEERLLRG